MPIITVQRRMAEQGRIRLGHKVTGTSRQGKTFTRPAKLDRFRFTSPSARLIEEVAKTYGGTAQPWDNDGKAEHEVITDATAIPVIVVKGGFSQWHEFWTRGGCQHRCDGEKDPAGTYCDPQDPAHLQAIDKPTTRLSVMLAEIETLGVWRMESKGWNAAAELPSMAELAMHVGDLVPATLGLAERSAIIQTDKGPQTSRFVVPTLDLHVTKARLVELVGGVGGTAALEQAGAPSGAVAIEAPPVDEGTWRSIDECESVEDARALWVSIRDSGAMRPDVDAAIKARVAELQAGDVSDDPTDYDEDAEPEKARAAAAKKAAQEAPLDEPVDAEVVEEPATPGDRMALWQQVLAAAGAQGMGSTELADNVKAWTGKTVQECDAADFQATLHTLTTGEVA